MAADAGAGAKHYRELRSNPPPLPVDEIAEAIQFLEWLADDNFTLLGARDYAFSDTGEALDPAFDTGLGLLRSRDILLLQRCNQPLNITADIREFLKEPKLLIVTKAAIRSRVHRRVYLDYIGIKRFDRDGKLVGERRSAACSPRPPIRVRPAPFPICGARSTASSAAPVSIRSSHSGKALVNVLENYPRDELFQIDDDTLYQFALAILQLDERPRVRVLPRRDRFDRFVSILVYVPRDRYDGQIRAAIGNYLADGLQRARLRAYYPFFPEGPLVRVHYIIGRDRRRDAEPRSRRTRSRRRSDRAQLDRRLREALVAGARSQPRRGAVRSLPRCFPGRLSRGLCADRGASPISASSRRWHRSGRSVSNFIAPPMAVRKAPGSKSSAAAVRSRCPSACRCWKIWVSASSTSAPIISGRAMARPIWFHDMTLESAIGREFDLAALKDAARGLLPGGDGARKPRATAITRWCLPPASAGATSR